MPFVDNAGLENFQHLFDDFFVVVVKECPEHFLVVVDKNKGAEDEDFEVGTSFLEGFDGSSESFNEVVFIVYGDGLSFLMVPVEGSAGDSGGSGELFGGRIVLELTIGDEDGFFGGAETFIRHVFLCKPTICHISIILFGHYLRKIFRVKSQSGMVK